jgi:hypothetical protein
MTLHADLMRRADAHIGWEDIAKQPFLEALTAELRKPGSVLDGLLSPYVRPGSLNLSLNAQQLRANPGLNPEGPTE